MKSIPRIFSICMLITILNAGCSDQTGKPPKTEENTKNTSTDTAQLDSVKVTFIELGSVNCIPCKMMQPVMEAIEKDYKDQVKVVFHDVWTDEGRPYASQYNIRIIPTQVFLDKDGNEFARHEGYMSKEDLVAVLKQQGVD